MQEVRFPEEGWWEGAYGRGAGGGEGLKKGVLELVLEMETQGRGIRTDWGWGQEPAPLAQ